MTTEMIVKNILIGGLALFYLVYTIRYSFLFSKNIFFKDKKIHFVLIWLLPFIWILLLKAFLKPTPGSHQVKRGKNPESFTESDLGIWADTSSHHSAGQH